MRDEKLKIKIPLNPLNPLRLPNPLLLPFSKGENRFFKGESRFSKGEE